VSATRLPLTALYEKDETAWLDTMSVLAAGERTAEMDFVNLSEFLSSMARRDRRKVRSCLVVLMTHLLKWEFQPIGRGKSWTLTIREQRSELQFELQSGTLRNYAEEVFEEAYEQSRLHAEAETGLSESTFPEKPMWTLDAVLAD